MRGVARRNVASNPIALRIVAHAAAHDLPKLAAEALLERGICAHLEVVAVKKFLEFVVREFYVQLSVHLFVRFLYRLRAQLIGFGFLGRVPPSPEESFHAHPPS